MAEIPETRRGEWVRGTTLGIGVVLAAALLVIVNYFGWKYHHRFDWTASDLYSLSEKSENVVTGLDKDVQVVVFLSPGSDLYQPVRELLSRYEAASPRISVRYLDSERNPIEAEQLVSKYEVDSASVVFDTGDDRRVVEEADLAEFDFSGMQMGEGPQMTGFAGEQLFTGALLELAEERKPKVLFTTGHGERRLDDFGPQGLRDASELLGKDNFVVEEWASLGQPGVPEGTDLVVIAGPTASFVEPELEIFSRYLAGGGRLLVMLDPTFDPAGGMVATGLEEWLGEYGIDVGDDVVLDPANPLPFFGAETLFVTRYGGAEITRSLNQANVPVLVSLARSVGREPAMPEEVSSQEIFFTSGEGWGERDLDTLAIGVEQGEGDLTGPVSLGVVATAAGTAQEETEELRAEAEPEDEPAAGDADGEQDTPELRLVVFGDSDFASNRLLQANIGNRVLLADTLNWLVEREALLGIPPKEPEHVRLNLTLGEVRWIYALVLLILPGSAIALGVLVYVRRRR